MHLAFATFLKSNQHVPRAHPTIGTARAARVAFDKSSPQRDGKGPIKCVFLGKLGTPWCMQPRCDFGKDCQGARGIGFG